MASKSLNNPVDRQKTRPEIEGAEEKNKMKNLSDQEARSNHQNSSLSGEMENQNCKAEEKEIIRKRKPNIDSLLDQEVCLRKKRHC